MNFRNKTQVTGFILSLLMLFTLINSSYFFLFILKLNIGKWLAFNACSLAIMVYLICYIGYRITKKEELLAFPLLPLYYYGTMGLFIMPWNEANVFAQITHIIITINILWIMYMLLKERKYESIGKGILIATFIFVPIFAYIQTYNQLHINEFMQALQSISMK
jgi:hypothetical protein